MQASLASTHLKRVFSKFDVSYRSLAPRQNEGKFKNDQPAKMLALPDITRLLGKDFSSVNERAFYGDPFSVKYFRGSAKAPRLTCPDSVLEYRGAAFLLL